MVGNLLSTSLIFAKSLRSGVNRKRLSLLGSWIFGYGTNALSATADPAEARDSDTSRSRTSVLAATVSAAPLPTPCWENKSVQVFLVQHVGMRPLLGNTCSVSQMTQWSASVVMR